MNKQELIERIEGLKNLFGNKSKYIEIDMVIRLISELDEPQKVTVPQFVADWYEKHKDDFETKLFRAVDLIPSDYEEDELSEFEEWLVDEHTAPFQTLVNMHQFGYEVEEEKRYIVKFKNIQKNSEYLKYDLVIEKWYFGMNQYFTSSRLYHTKEELEKGGFEWLFSCEGVEIEEVEE